MPTTCPRSDDLVRRCERRHPFRDYENTPQNPRTIVRRLSQPNTSDHLTLEIVLGETRYDLARKRTNSPFAFLERISAI